MSKPVFLVLGATGAQGGSVVRALLRNGKYKIRGLTRNIESENAKKLVSQGVELVKGDYRNAEDLKKALVGAEIVFGLTNFWDPTTMGKETEFGKVIVDQVKAAKVKHFIWSTLPNSDRESNGKYHVPHFTDKALVDDYIIQQGVPTTFVALAFYYQNFQYFFPPKKDDDGTYVFTLPETTNLTATDVNDIGETVVVLAENRDKYLGQFIPLAGDQMPPQEYVDQFAHTLGVKAKLNLVNREAYSKLGFPGAEELAQMFGWFNEFTFFGKRDPTLGHKVNPNLKTWKQFLQAGGLKV